MADISERNRHGDLMALMAFARRSIPLLQTLYNFIREEGALGHRLLVEAPDLWILRPATSVRMGILGALIFLVCPRFLWELAARRVGIRADWINYAYDIAACLVLLCLVLRSTFFATVEQLMTFGQRVSTYRPRYFRVRVLIITALPLVAFLPGFFLSSVFLPNPWFDSVGPLRPKILTISILLASGYGVYINCLISLEKKLFGPENFIEFLGGILLIFLTICAALYFILASLNKLFGIHDSIAAGMAFLLALAAFSAWARWVWNDPEAVAFRRSLLLHTFLFVIPSIMIVICLFLKINNKSMMIILPVVSFYPPIVSRLLESWIDRIAFAPPDHKDSMS